MDEPHSPTAHPRRPVRSFVMRGGRLGSGQQRALVELGPQFVLPYRASMANLPMLFGRHAPVVLEIGFGMGDATAAIAARRPRHGLHRR